MDSQTAAVLAAHLAMRKRAADSGPSKPSGSSFNLGNILDRIKNVDLGSAKEPLKHIGGGALAGLVGGLGHYAMSDGGSRNLLHSLLGGAALGGLGGASMYGVPKLFGAAQEAIKEPDEKEVRSSGATMQGPWSTAADVAGLVPGAVPGAILGVGLSAMPKIIGQPPVNSALAKAQENAANWVTELTNKITGGTLQGKELMKAEELLRSKANPALAAADDAIASAKSLFGGRSAGRIAGNAALGAGGIVARNVLDRHGGWVGTGGRVVVDSALGHRFLQPIAHAAARSNNKTLKYISAFLPAIVGAVGGQGYNSLIRDRK